MVWKQVSQTYQFAFGIEGQEGVHVLAPDARRGGRYRVTIEEEFVVCCEWWRSKFDETLKRCALVEAPETEQHVKACWYCPECGRQLEDDDDS